jgi:trans-2-enoyl-CoA reductase
MENKKQFDCLKMKQDIQKQIYAETKNMTSKELLQYFNNNKKENVKLPGTVNDNADVPLSVFA